MRERRRHLAALHFGNVPLTVAFNHIVKFQIDLGFATVYPQRIPDGHLLRDNAITALVKKLNGFVLRHARSTKAPEQTRSNVAASHPKREKCDKCSSQKAQHARKNHVRPVRAKREQAQPQHQSSFAFIRGRV